MILKRILLIIPLLIAIGFIIDCWVEIATTDTIVQWQHYTALAFLGVVIYFFFKDFTKAIISTGAFLFVGTFNAFSMTADIYTAKLRVGPVETPPFNSLAISLLFLFVILNFWTMINLYLDYKEMKNKKIKNAK